MAHHSIQVIIGHCGPHFETSTTDFCSAQAFVYKAETRFGQSVRVVGNCPKLGNWDPAKAPALTTDVRLACLEISWNDAV